MSNPLTLTDDRLEQYIESHISPEPDHLKRLYRHTWLHHLYPRMCSGHLQGRILKMLTSMIAPKRVLELGTFTGYSTLCIAEGLQPGATLDTVEIDDEMDDELRERFADYPSITLHIGDAAEVVGRMPGEWDMVFVDADKRRYRISRHAEAAYGAEDISSPTTLSGRDGWWPTMQAAIRSCAAFWNSTALWPKIRNWSR